MLLLFGTSATIRAGQGRAGCRECHHFDAGRCLFTRAIVAESFLCLRFAARQPAPTPTPEPSQAAPLPTPEPLPPAPPVKPVLDLPAETVTVTEPARSVRHRQRFSFAAWLRQVLKINCLGRSNFHFSAQLHGDEVNTNQERKTHEERI
jgi:hypothetical protein